MNHLESILFLYKNEYRVEYQYYAEFFRLIGIYVCEDVIYDNIEKFDYQYCPKDFSFEYKVMSHINFSNDSKENLKNVIKKAFDVEEILDWQKDLIEIYEEHKLLQASVALQYYRMKATAILENGKKFEDAADALVKLIDENPQYAYEKNVRYAKLYCKQKANLAKYLCEEPLIYYVNGLALEGLALIKQFEDFSNVWVLLGLIYEVSKEFTRDAIDAYQRALELVGDKPYASSIYYWRGRKCEEYIALKALENESYHKAYNLMEKYRNIYKIAKYHYDKKEQEKAYEYFVKCIQKIERKKDYLDPLEQQYYFKVYVILSSIYLKQEDYYNAIISAKKAIELRDGISNGKKQENNYTRFYYEIFDRPEKYISLTLNRMGTRQVYQHLATACQACGMIEEAEEYWEIVRA